MPGAIWWDFSGATTWRYLLGLSVALARRYLVTCPVALPGAFWWDFSGAFAQCYLLGLSGAFARRYLVGLSGAFAWRYLVKLVRRNCPAQTSVT